MTVKELIEKLSKYDPNTEVMIGMYQKYGSDFAYEIAGIESSMMFSSNGFREDIPQGDVIFLLEGSAEGTMADPEDEDWEDEEDYEEE